jgi:inactivated superfamily I helicase
MADNTETQQPENGRIDVATAVRAASGFLHSVFQEEDARDLRLEEVEFADDTNQWLVTLSFLRPVADEELTILNRELAKFEGRKFRREYKSVAVDAETGEARSIKMRSAV